MKYSVCQKRLSGAVIPSAALGCGISVVGAATKAIFGRQKRYLKARCTRKARGANEKAHFPCDFASSRVGALSHTSTRLWFAILVPTG